jgi:hypothetical protein
MDMKRILAVLLAVLMLTLCGCNAIIIENGNLHLVANDIDHVKITNGSTQKTFSIMERETIGTIVSHLNSYTLENGTSAESDGFSYRYRITLVDKTNGSAESHFYFPDTQTIRIDDAAYNVNTRDLLQFIETKECDTLTDNELIDILLNGDTLEQLNIIGEEGKISVDKILNLPKNCPALFELLSRPSAIESISGYGTDRIGDFLGSTNPALVEKAQEWIDVLQNLVPEVREKLEDLIKNYKISENNP